MSSRQKVFSLILALTLISDSAPAQEENQEQPEVIRLAPKIWNTDGTILCFPKCDSAGPCC